MEICLIYRLARVGRKGIGRLINITLEISLSLKRSNMFASLPNGGQLSKEIQ